MDSKTDAVKKTEEPKAEMPKKSEEPKKAEEPKNAESGKASADQQKPESERDHLLWNGLNRGTSWLYAVVRHSLLGRVMTGYRRADKALGGGRGHHACAPRSPARLALLRVMEGSRLLNALWGLFGGLYACPAAIYGLFGLSYGLGGVLLYFLLPFLYPSLAPDRAHLMWCAVMALLSLPWVFSRKSAGGVLERGLLSGPVLTELLGIPQEHTAKPVSRRWALLWYLCPILGLGGAVGALYIHPLIIPLAMAGLGLLGMIFSHPEAGVVLSTLTLPAVWLNRNLMTVAVAIILLTWISYGIKLLLLHRTLRFGLLDRVVLIMGLLLAAYGCTGHGVSAETVLRSICLLVCLSDYFLIVNLMNTRAYIRRCLFGVGLSVVLVTFLSYLRLIPVDGLLWLEGSRAGDAILDAVREGYAALSQLWVEHSELYLVLVFPWLYAYLIHTKRFFRKVMGVLFVGLDAALIVMTDSVSALFCIVGVTVLFFLLLDHRCLTAGILAFPALGCGAVWAMWFFPLSDRLQTVLSRSRHYKALLSDSLWEMVKDHPMGIGLGEEAFTRVYPAYAAPDLGAVTDSGSLLFEILLSYGWVGLLLFAALLFLFWQKGLTCLGHTAATRDRAMILGGTVSLTGAVIFGTVRSFVTSPRVFFTLLLVIALCSAYENILFEESDVREAALESSPLEEHRLYKAR